jgi:hypothetical protein
MTAWRYLFYDIVSGQYRGELPLEAVSFDIVMPAAGAGSFSGAVPLMDPRVRGMNWRAATEPRRNLVFTERDGQLLPCAHFVWDTVYHRKARTLELQGAEVWSWFQHIIISGDRIYANVDQFDVIRDLLLRELAEPGGIRITVDPPGTRPLTGRMRTVSYLATQGKQLAQAVTELSQLIDGFDFVIDVSRDPVSLLPQLRVVLAYPRLGRDNSGLVFTLPGDVEDFDWPRQGSQVATRAIALGSGTTVDADGTGGSLVAVAYDQNQIAAGAPRLDVVQTHSGVTDIPTLQAYAASDLSSRLTPIGVPTMPVRADLNPVLGSYQLGDTVTISLEDDAYFTPSWVSPDGLDYRVRAPMRLVGVSVTPADDTAKPILDSPDAINIAVRNRPIADAP